MELWTAEFLAIQMKSRMIEAKIWKWCTSANAIERVAWGSKIDLIQTWMGWSTKMRVLTGPFNSHQLILATLQPRKRCSTDCRWLDESGRLGSSVFGSRWVDESGNVSLVGKKGNFPEKCLSLSCNLSFQRVFHSELDKRLVRVGLNCWSITWANRNIGTAFWIL